MGISGSGYAGTAVLGRPLRGFVLERDVFVSDRARPCRFVLGNSLIEIVAAAR